MVCWITKLYPSMLNGTHLQQFATECFEDSLAFRWDHHGTKTPNFVAVFSWFSGVRTIESSLSGLTHRFERPDTWVTVCTGHIGDTSSPRGGSDALEGVFGYG